MASNHIGPMLADLPHELGSWPGFLAFVASGYQHRQTTHVREENSVRPVRTSHTVRTTLTCLLFVGSHGLRDRGLDRRSADARGARLDRLGQ